MKAETREEKLLDYLRAHPETPGDKIPTRLRGALRDLERRGVIAWGSSGWVAHGLATPQRPAVAAQPAPGTKVLIERGRRGDVCTPTAHLFVAGEKPRESSARTYRLAAEVEERSGAQRWRVVADCLEHQVRIELASGSALEADKALGVLREAAEALGMRRA